MKKVTRIQPMPHQRKIITMKAAAIAVSSTLALTSVATNNDSEINWF